MRILVLVLSTRNHNYSRFVNAIRNGWKIDLEKKGIDVYFYEGDHKVECIDNDTLKLVVKDDLLSTAEKFKAAIKLLKKENIEYDILYRTNLSSFIDAKNFVRFVNKFEKDSFIYNGLIGETNKVKEFFYLKNKYLSFLFSKIRISEKIIFASGSGLFLDKKSAQEVADSKKFNQYIDDVMIALCLNKKPNQNNLIPIRFYILEDLSHKVTMNEYMQLINDDVLFHYRFKTNDRNKDADNVLNFSSKEYRLNYCVTSDKI